MNSKNLSRETSSLFKPESVYSKSIVETAAAKYYAPESSQCNKESNLDEITDADEYLDGPETEEQE